MSTGWIIVLAAVAVFIVGSAVFGDSFAESIGGILGMVFCAAVVLGAVYGAIVMVTGHDPLGLGWNDPPPAIEHATKDDVDLCDLIGASARFQPGC